MGKAEVNSLNRHGSVSYPFWAAVPEPADWVMLTVDFMGVGLMASAEAERTAASSSLSVLEIATTGTLSGGLLFVQRVWSV